MRPFNLIFLAFAACQLLTDSDKLALVEFVTVAAYIVISAAIDTYNELTRQWADQSREVAKVDCFNYNRASFKPKLVVDCQPGDLIRVKKDSYVPADMVLLHADGSNASIMIDTSAVDGQRGLKEKWIIPSLDLEIMQDADLQTLQG